MLCKPVARTPGLLVRRVKMTVLQRFTKLYKSLFQRLLRGFVCRVVFHDLVEFYKRVELLLNYFKQILQGYCYV